MEPSEGRSSPDVDPATVRRVVSGRPIRLAVLFGSHARGTQTAESDVDVAVAFDGSLSPEARHRARLDLTVALMEALETDDVDVLDLETLPPAVGASALRTGIVLVGDPDLAAELAAQFEDRVTSRTHEERMRQFDELLDRLENTV